MDVGEVSQSVEIIPRAELAYICMCVIVGFGITLAVWYSSRTGSWRQRQRGFIWAIVAYALAIEFAACFTWLALYNDTLTTRIVATSISTVVVFVAAGKWLTHVQPKTHPCPHCGKRLQSLISWTCGYCDNEDCWNLLSRCHECSAKAVLVECYYCGKRFSLTGDSASNTHTARKTPKPLPGESEEQAKARRAREVNEREHRTRVLELDAEISKREKRLAELNAPPRDASRERGRVFSHLVEAMRADVKSVEQAKKEQSRLIAEIEGNASLSEAEKVSLKEMASDLTEHLCERIRAGGIRV